jgi:asparagine synthase (glutamine-hydrolysing)
MLRNWEEQLVAAASETNASAFFGGTGGDNVFCSLGSAAPATDTLRVFGPGTRFFSAAHAVARVHHDTVWSATRRALRQALRPRPPQAWPRVDDFVAPEVRSAAPPFHPWLIEPDDALPGTRGHIRSIMAAQAHLDGYLRHAVAPSVFPLLAQPVIEACLGVPTWTWIEGGVDRAVARHAFATRLPEIIVQRQTKGMMNAFSAQAYARNRSRLIPFLLDGHLARRGIIDRSALEPYLRQTGPVRDTRFYRVLALVDVELWLRGWLDD